MTRHQLLVLIFIISRLVSALIIRIVHVVAESLDAPDLVSDPLGRVFGELLNVVNGAVPFVLNLVFRAVPFVLNFIRYLLGFSDLGLVKKGRERSVSKEKGDKAAVIGPSMFKSQESLNSAVYLLSRRSNGQHFQGIQRHSPRHPPSFLPIRRLHGVSNEAWYSTTG